MSAPTSTARAKNQDRARETHLGNIITQHMYAVIKDNDHGSDRFDPCKSIANQTYDNLILKSDDPKKIDAAEPRFTIQSEVKQQLTYILKCVGSEIGSSGIALGDSDKVISIIEKLVDEFGDDSVVAPFFSLGASTDEYFGKTLRQSADSTNWLQAQIIGILPHLKTKLHLIAEITSAFDNSLRAIAWYLARGVWFGAEKKSISSSSLMYVLGMPCITMYSLNTIDLISQQVRMKVVKAKKSNTVEATPNTAADIALTSNNTAGELTEILNI